MSFTIVVQTTEEVDQIVTSLAQRHKAIYALIQSIHAQVSEQLLPPPQADTRVKPEDLVSSQEILPNAPVFLL